MVQWTCFGGCCAQSWLKKQGESSLGTCKSFDSCCSYIPALSILLVQRGRRGGGKMHADPGLLLPFLQGLPQELSWGDHRLTPLPSSQDLLSISLDNLIHTSAVSDYDLGGDGDLFNAPKPVVEESLLAVDPVSAALSMISGYGSAITDETIQISDMKSIENEDLLCEVLNDLKGDLLSKTVTNVPTLEASDIPVSLLPTEGYSAGGKDDSSAEGSLQKTISLRCLSTVDSANPSSVEPCLLGLHEMNFESAFGIRRAYSEGDIEILGTNNPVHGIMNTFPSGKFLASMEDAKIEEKIEARRIKLSRYRKKRTSRNYGRKIKYACRKALADCQPRVRGRFAKIEVPNATSKQ